MNDTDKTGFKKLMDGLAAMYGQAPADPDKLKAWFALLKPYTLEQLTEASRQHFANPEGGKYFPRPIDFRQILDSVKTITPERIIEEARLARTPLGVMARIEIGTWDLNNQNDFYLKQRAEAILLQLPEWKERAQQGRYTRHQVEIMLKHGVRPSAPFTTGIPGPSADAAIALESKLARLELKAG